MDTAAACQIARLPEELIWAAISRTSPRDACRAAAVSPAFRAAADSDAVWSTFLPRDLPPLADGELSPAPTSKKGLFLRLSDRRRPFLLQDRPWSYWLDRETGAKCYMLFASALRFSWSEKHREYWDCYPLDDSRSSEEIQILGICALDICGVIHSKMLSQNSTYAAYMVSRIPDLFPDTTFTNMDAHVRVGESKSTRRVILADKSTSPVIPGGSNDYYRNEDTLLPEERSDGWVEVAQLQERSDGWMEVEMGEFYNDEGVDDEVHITLMGDEHGAKEPGLIMQGIEIRPKKSGQEASVSDGESKSTRRVVVRDDNSDDDSEMSGD